MRVSVSGFAASFADMGADLSRIGPSGADSLHVDVMDGHFVPLMGLGTSWLAAARPFVDLPIEVHLMTIDASAFVPQYLESGADSVVFHAETESQATTLCLLKVIRGRGVRCGLAIAPETDLRLLDPFIPFVDEFLIMSTEPGRAGLSFDLRAFKRIRSVRDMVRKANRPIIVAVDGGIDEALAGKCAESGADKVIMGRAFFRSENPRAMVARLHSALGPASQKNQ
jgi:ribulose-phosphate 3-epimerase